MEVTSGVGGMFLLPNNSFYDYRIEEVQIQKKWMRVGESGLCTAY